MSIMKKHAVGATKDQFETKLAIKLKDHGRHGNELLMELPEFAEMQRKLWIQKTSQQGIDFGVDKFITTDGKKTMWAKLSNIVTGNNIKQKWKDDYQAFDKEFKELVKNGLGRPSAIPEIAMKTKNLFSKSVLDLPIILAHIFAVWSLEKSSFDADSLSENREYILQPHAIQILCVFRMLTQDGKQ